MHVLTEPFTTDYCRPGSRVIVLECYMLSMQDIVRA